MSLVLAISLLSILISIVTLVFSFRSNRALVRTAEATNTQVRNATLRSLGPVRSTDTICDDLCDEDHSFCFH